MCILTNGHVYLSQQNFKIEHLCRRRHVFCCSSHCCVLLAPSLLVMMLSNHSGKRGTTTAHPASNKRPQLVGGPSHFHRGGAWHARHILIFIVTGWWRRVSSNLFLSHFVLLVYFMQLLENTLSLPLPLLVAFA